MKNPLIKFSSIFLVSLLLILSSACSLSGTDSNSVEKRLKALETESRRQRLELWESKRKLSGDLFQKVKELRRSQRYLMAELDSIKEEMELLTSQYEVNAQHVRQNYSRLKRLRRQAADQQVAFDELKNYFESSIHDMQAMSKAEQKDFKLAFSLYKKRDFIAALKKFGKFATKHPKSELTDDARYYIGYIYLLLKDNASSSLHLSRFVRHYPLSNRIHDGQWWLAIAYERGGDQNAAIDLYKRLSMPQIDESWRIRAENRLRLLGIDINEVLEP